MSIYTIQTANYRRLTFVQESPAELDRIELFKQTNSIVDLWDAPKMRPYTIREEMEAPDWLQRLLHGLGDCPWYTSGFITVSDKAKRALDNIIGLPIGEFLPLNVTRGGTFWAYHCMNRLDALDRDASELDYYDDGSPHWVMDYVFKKEVVKNQDIFTIKWPTPYILYVSDRVIDRIKEAKLVGFQWEQVWSSDL